jgi:hypothetical protein
MPAKNAPVAQLDRAPDYESGGQEFESLRARQYPFATTALFSLSQAAASTTLDCGSNAEAASANFSSKSPLGCPLFKLAPSCIIKRSVPNYSSRADTLHSSSQTDQSLHHPVKSRGGEATKTNQRRTCRMSLARGRHRTPRCRRRSAGGHQRAARAVRGWMAPAVQSRRPFRRLGKGEATQVIRSLGCLAARCKECPLIRLQKLNPRGDIARAPDVPIKAKFCTQERRTQLRNEFLGRIVA